MTLVKYTNWAVDAGGNTIASSDYDVRDTSGILVQIYSDSIGTTKTNPSTADASGKIEFYVDKGVYDITVGSGLSATTQRAAIGGPDVAYFASRADAVAAVAAGSAEIDGRSLMFDGTVWYKYSSGATAISDMPNWLPVGSTVYIKHWTDNLSAPDATAALGEAIDYVSSNEGFTLDGMGETIRFSSTYSFSGFSGRRITNFNFEPHSSWVSVYPGDSNGVWLGASIPAEAGYTTSCLFNIPSGAGNITIDNCFFDGRDSSGVPAADFILWQAGGNHVTHNKVRGFANYGVWIVAATDGVLTHNEVYQWAFANSENGQAAKRTAACMVIGTGDVQIHDNIAHGSQVPLVVYGSGACTFTNDHYYNGASSGDVTTAGRSYNARITQEARPVFNGTYFDKGVLRLEAMQVQLQSCRFLTNDAAIYDPVFIELAPQSAGTPLNGLMIHGCDFQGEKTSAAIPAADFFVVDTTDGTLSGSEDNVIVENNSYHYGPDRGSVVPSTSGTARLTLASGDWLLDTGAYKSGTINLSAYLFLPTAIAYNFVFSVQSNAGAKPYTEDPSTLQKVSSAELQFWCASNPDVSIHLAWDGRANVLL